MRGRLPLVLRQLLSILEARKRAFKMCRKCPVKHESLILAQNERWRQA